MILFYVYDWETQVEGKKAVSLSLCRQRWFMGRTRFLPGPLSISVASHFSEMAGVSFFLSVSSENTPIFEKCIEPRDVEAKRTPSNGENSVWRS